MLAGGVGGAVCGDARIFPVLRSHLGGVPGIVTLSITLVLERFMAQTAGPEWKIGNRPSQRLQRHEQHALPHLALAGGRHRALP